MAPRRSRPLPSGPRRLPPQRPPQARGRKFGEHTLLRVLEKAGEGKSRWEDLAEIPNLVLPAGVDSWHPTREEAEPVDLEEGYTRWDLIESMPAEAPTIEFDEYSPIYDDKHYNTALVIDRMMRAFLGGKALRDKQGITDPNYVDGEVLDHGHRED